MATNLSNHFRERRLQLGLRHGEVARLMGYKSLVGACNKIVRFEKTGDIRTAMCRKLAAVLGIDETAIQRLVEEDWREYIAEWTAWANQPVKPEIIFRAIPGVFVRHPLPEHLQTTEEMEQYTQKFAKMSNKKTWLVLSRRLMIYFNENGIKSVQEAAPGECNSPEMRVGNKKFLFGVGSGGLGITPITEPEKHGLGKK
jgi:hypothetical protein